VTEPRTIYAISFGKLISREYIYYCPSCKKLFTSDDLSRLVKAGCTYSYDCLVEIGKLRYLEKRQIEDIKNILYVNYDIPISSTQIKRLCYQFLLYLGRFHYSNVTIINKNISRRGGYILHIDSTCEGRKPHLLTCIDSLSGYILYSQKINSENEAELLIIFERVKELFGIPLVIVSDMGAGINKACAIIFKGVAYVICHFHLLRDLGKDYFEIEYRQLQKKLSYKKIYDKIRYQIKKLEEVIASEKEAQQLLLRLKKQEDLSPTQLLQGILYGYLLSLKSSEYSGDGYGFPFDRPKIQYYNKIIEIYKEIEHLETKDISWADKQKSRLYEIKNVLRKVTHDKSLRKNVKNIKAKALLFDELRQIMRIALPNKKQGLNDEGKIEDPVEIKKMETSLIKFVDKLKGIADESIAESSQLKGVISQLEKYWDKIFTEPIKITTDGNDEKIIIPQRTNNISEQFYRKLKQLFRRLHGRRHVGKDLIFLPEEIALVQNLNNYEYVSSMFGLIDNLVNKFAQLDRDSVELPFEKEKLDLFVPQKIQKFLKTFKSKECVDTYFNRAA